ncbi:Uncharacterised protein [Mycobacterium tuberculosis]|nr:Uncharacterised protein [Mycobacterium tuberculosis]
MIDTQDLCRSGEFLPAHLTEVSVGPAECGGLVGEAQSSQPRSLRREITQYRPEPEGLVVRMGEHSKHFVCAGETVAAVHRFTVRRIRARGWTAAAYYVVPMSNGIIFPRMTGNGWTVRS